MTSVKLMLNKCRAHKTGTYPLVFQVIHSRRKKLIYLGFNLREEEFDAEKGKILHCTRSEFTREEQKRMNEELKSCKRRMKSLVYALDVEGREYTTEEIAGYFLRKPIQLCLISYMNKQISKKKEQGKEGIAAAYLNTRNSLQIFIKNEDVKMSEIDNYFVMNYREYLFKKKLSPNTISYYMRNFRTIFNMALAEGLKPKDKFPFKNIRTTPCKTVKRALSLSQTKALICLDLSCHPGLEKARDFYMFSLYCQGMAFVDIVFLEKKNIVEDVIYYSRHKSKQCIRIKISDRIRQLMEKYSSNNSKYVFPFIDITSKSTPYRQYRSELSNINRNLKKVAAMTEITVPLTTYTARHTWATLAHECGASISLISEGMGHTSEEMTRIYLKQFDIEVLDSVNNMVLNLL